MKQVAGIIVSLVVVYILFSVLVPRQYFYFANALWLLTILLGCLVLGGVSFRFSRQQWFIVASTFVLTYVGARLISPQENSMFQFNSLVLTPLAEELFFRGWVLSKITGSVKRKVFLNSVIFSLYHLKNIFIFVPSTLLFQVFYAFLVVGPVLTWLRLRYNSLFPGLILHNLNNTWALSVTQHLFPSFIRKL